MFVVDSCNILLDVAPRGQIMRWGKDPSSNARRSESSKSARAALRNSCWVYLNMFFIYLYRGHGSMNYILKFLLE